MLLPMDAKVTSRRGGGGGVRQAMTGGGSWLPLRHPSLSAILISEPSQWLRGEGLLDYVSASLRWVAMDVAVVGRHPVGEGLQGKVVGPGPGEDRD
jgi:hypothetical protein